MPPIHRLPTGPCKQVSSRLVPEPVVNPGFDSMFIRNDASSASLLSLIFPIRTCHPSRMTFPRSLTTTPFERSSTGRFEACPCRPASGGLLPSLIQHHRLPPVFVTHTTAVDKTKQEVRSRGAGSGTAGRGTGACAAMPTRPARTRWSERRAIRDGIAVGESPAH
jgi:hypothetical protein